MKWLLRLYPAGWRRRYGDEFTELVASQPFSISTSIDIVAGAIDAWLQPQSSAAAPAAAQSKGTQMFANALRLRCAGYGPTVTAADKRKTVGITLVGTVVLTGVWMWASSTFPDNPYVESMGVSGWMIPWLYSLRYTTLKGRSRGVQCVFVGGLTTFLMAVSALASWIGAR